MMGLVRSRVAIPANPPRAVARVPARPALISLRSAPAQEDRRHAGEDPEPQGVVGFELVDGFLDTVGHVAVDGVAGFGTVDRDDGHVAFGGVLDGRHLGYFGWRRAAPSMRMVSPFM
jgi:hypothetical protein